MPDQSTRDLAACRSWEDVRFAPRGLDRGIGFVTTGGIAGTLPDGSTVHLLLLDVDACRDPITGEIETWARPSVPIYAEVSPSGTGLRFAFFLQGTLPRLRGKVRRERWYPAPNCGDKKPEVQVFGLGPAGYVTITGVAAEGFATTPPLLAALQPLLDAGLVELDEDEPTAITPGGAEVLPEEITKAVAQDRRGAALIEARWKEVMPRKSASEAFHLLASLALNAANGHQGATTHWLLTATAWGRGDVDDCADPSKYMRQKWVAADVARAAQKAPPPAVAEFDALPALPASAPKAIAPEIGDPAAVFDAWDHDGPVTRLSTGIPTLDEMTGGGFVLGSRVYLVGAPNAGKTALAVQLADYFLSSGVPCGILGVDEEPVDLVTRLLQRRGITRQECEERSGETRARAREAIAALPLRLFDGQTSVEEAAVAVHKFARSREPDEERPECVLFIDSVQVARSAADGDEDSLYRSVTRRVAAIRTAASRYRMLVVVTSEMNRGAYRSKRAQDQTTDMASAKESGAIEFSARVLLSLRSVPGSSDMIELRIAKNKHGADHRDDQEGIFLRVDRGAQSLTEDREFRPLDRSELAQRDPDFLRDAGLLAARLAFEGDMGRNSAATATGLPTSRINALRDYLAGAGAIVEIAGPNKRRVMHLVSERLPEDVRAAMAKALGS